MITDMIGLYVHIPFCVRKCNYCDFCSFDKYTPQMRKSYIEALKREISSYKKTEKISVETLFFGGGTPSVLSPLEFLDIFSEIENSFDLTQLSEFTLEVNPKTVNEEKLKAYKTAGVNRISIGLQSIHENEEKILGRIHNLEDFLHTYKLVKNAGIDNVSVDLMYGIPEQTEASFLESLQFLVKLGVPHISVYGLIIEENTPFGTNRSSLALPSEDEEADMYFSAARLLSENAYSHYEISNYAKQGFESRHNLKYWLAEEYIGVGLAAHSYFGKVRYGNTSELCEYFSRHAEQYRTEESIDRATEAYEYVMLALRLSSGFSLDEYKKRFDTDFLDGRYDKILQYQRLGLLKIENGRLFLTEQGFYVSNSIISDLI